MHTNPSISFTFLLGVVRNRFSDNYISCNLILLATVYRIFASFDIMRATKRYYTEQYLIILKIWRIKKNKTFRCSLCIFVLVILVWRSVLKIRGSKIVWLISNNPCISFSLCHNQSKFTIFRRYTPVTKQKF